MWTGFLGAWLLVAGPAYQASLELRAEDAAIESVRAVQSRMPPPPPVSPWWWLVPPVHLVRSRQRRQDHRQQMIDAMEPDEFTTLTRFVNKATGWLYVAGGGFLLALRATYDVVTDENWPTVVFWALVLLMTALSLANIAARQAHGIRATDEHRRRHQTLVDAEPTEGPRPRRPDPRAACRPGRDPGQRTARTTVTSSRPSPSAPNPTIDETTRTTGR